MRLLAVEIADAELRVARGERTFGVLRLTALERVPVPTPDALPGVLAGVARPRPDLVLTALPAHAVTHRIFVLPFRDRRRIARTAPLELLGQLPVDGDGLTVACVPLGSVDGGSAVLAVAAREADLEAHRALLAAAGIEPARIELGPLPALNLLADDAALLVADGARSAVVVRRDGRLAGLRALGADARDPHALAAEARWTLAALGDAPRTIVLAGADADGVLADALAAETGVRVVPFADAARLPLHVPAETLSACAVVAGLVAGAGRRARVGVALADRPTVGQASLRRAAALAALAVGLGAMDLGLVRHGLARQDARLTSAIRAEAAAALPGVRLVAPRAQLDAAVAATARREVRLGGRTSVLELLRELSARVPPAMRLDLDELTVAPDAVLLHGRCDSFDAVDGLRRALAGSPVLADVAAEETRTTVDGRGVEFRLRAARRPVQGASS
jgi:hypothetical protein